MAAHGIPPSLFCLVIINTISRVSTQHNAALIEDHDCHLHPYDPATKGSIARHQREGQLLMVTLNLETGPDVTLDLKDGEGEEGEDEVMFSEWYVTRPGDNFGSMTLALLQELPALSRLALPLFTEELEMRVVDTPHGCMKGANHSTRTVAAREMLLEDFTVHQTKVDGCVERDHSVCRLYDLGEPSWWQYPSYNIECCHLVTPDHVCVREEGSKLVQWMRCLLCLAKLCLYLVAPGLVARAFSSHTEHIQCEVLLATPISKTLLVKSTKVPQIQKEDKGGKSLQEPFSRLRESIKTVVTGRILNMSITKVCVSADRSNLVGVSSFTSDIVGKCGGRGETETVEGDGGCCRARLAMIAGITLAVALLSVPFYLRVVALCYLDKHLDELPTSTEYEGSSIWMVLASLHATFILTILLLLFAYRAGPKLCDTIFFSAFRDLRAISRRAVAGMICDNMKLPFKKFGRYGVIVAVLYWIVSLPVCFIVSLVYATPLFYILGRFFLYERPRMLSKKMTMVSSRDSSDMGCCCRTSAGTTLERYLQLEQISPGGGETQRLGCVRGFLALLLAAICVTHVITLLVIVGEILGLTGEVLIYATFYLFAHANKMIGYIVLFPGLGIYVCFLYKTERDFYMAYKARLFAVLDGLVESVVQDYQGRGGYEGASLARLGEQDSAFYLPDNILRDYLGQERAAPPSNRFLGRVDQQLYWCTSGLVYFIGKDKARYASADLLERVGSLQGPGFNPRRLITRRLCYLVLMLAYMSLASLVFAYVSELDGQRGASHVLLTLAFYGLPLVVFHVAGSRQPHIDVLSLKQTVCLAAQQHTHRWLVSDLGFPAPKPQSPTEPNPNAGADTTDGAASGEPSQPDPNNYSQDENDQRPSYVDFVFCVGVDEEERLEERTQDNREEFVMLPV